MPREPASTRRQQTRKANVDHLSNDVRPVRVVMPDLHLNGQPCAAINIFWPKGSDPDALLNDGEVIKEDEIRISFGMLKLVPDDKILKNLTVILNQMRVSTFPSALPKQHPLLVENALEKALRQITDQMLLPPETMPFSKVTQIIEELRKSEFLSHESAAENAIRRLFMEAQRLNSHIRPKIDGQRKSEWHYDAFFLAAQLDCFAVNKSTKLGYSKPTSPAVRFLDWALKRAGVDGLPPGLPEAIVQAMKRRKRNPPDPGKFSLKRGTT